MWLINLFKKHEHEHEHEPDTFWDLYKKTYVDVDWKGNLGEFFLEQCRKCGITYLPK